MECAAAHAVPAFLIVPIPMLYLIFAYQLWADTRHNEDTKAKRALLGLMVVFIFCALIGYAARLISIPDWLADASHLVLIVAMVGVVVTRQSVHIARALDGTRDA